MQFVGFDQPWYLLLLLFLPVMWVLSFRSLSGLGRVRRIVTLGLRSIVLLCLVLALAGIQYRKTGDRLTVIFLLDQSESIPRAKRDLMLSYVVKEVSVHRKRESDDRAGIIVFGRDATVEIPPFNDDIPSVGRLESLFAIRTDATNLESAMKLAHASFPEDSAKRIVVVTDGNENIGNARALGRVLVDDQVSIDVVPVELTARAEIAVEKITLPAESRRGQPLEARVVVSNFSNAGTAADGTPLGRTVKAKITVTRKGHDDTLLTEQVVDLPPGKQIFRIPHKIEQPDLYSYIATVTPIDTRDDLMSQNNTATAFTHVRGKGRILFIVDWKNQLDYEFLINRLKSMDLEVQVQRTDELFTSLAQLQAYDTVILADVPRSSSGDTNDSGETGTPQSFSDEQVKMLVRNLEMGSGLIMLGGPNSFGVGGWTNTELEKAMPVDFQVKNKKIQAVGALVLMMHASEMARGNYWQAVVAREAIKALGPMDYCGLIHWDNQFGDDWLWNKPKGLARVFNNRRAMLQRLNQMLPGDMPQFDPAMKMAYAGLSQVKASVKHMIIISDGDPSPPMNSTIANYAKAGIKISTVAVGTHGAAGSSRLQSIAARTKGKYYVVRNPSALPKIYQREARRVARPLIFEPQKAVVPQVMMKHEALQDVNVTLPPIKGFVLTTKKDSALVDVMIRSPLPSDGENATILASWNYGLGRAVVFTSDIGKTKPRWSTEWNNWQNFDRVFGQLVRWSMRPHDEKGKFHVANTIKNGRIRVVVTALDKNDDFLNMLDMTAVATTPDLKSQDITIRQTAPGRYVGELPVDKAGSYFLTINPGEGKPPILTGVNVPYSSEYRDRETNMALIRELSGYKPDGGEAGRLVKGSLTHDGVGQLVQANDTFRHDLPKAIAIHDIWPWLLLVGSVLFLGDVFVRRVTVGFDWFFIAKGWVKDRIFGKQEEEDSNERLERLRSRKAAIADQIDERRTATRFEPEVDEDTAAPDLDEVISETANTTAPARPQAPAADITPQDDDADNYTSRLLAAKKKAFKDKK